MRSESSAEETEAVVAAVDKGESQRKRKNDPGVRVVGGRIYCSVNGKTCHQVSLGSANVSLLRALKSGLLSKFMNVAS